MVSLFCGALCCILLNSTDVFSQDVSDGQSNSNLSATLKLGGVSPAMGISYQLNKKSVVRALGFFTVGTSESLNNQYLIDLSYIRYGKSSESLNPYWGINLNFQFKDPIVGPGLLLGASYSLSNNFAIFGEAGLNIYLIEGAGSARINLFNSGVGVKVKL